MNAIADNGYQVVDTFGGIADIRQKLIRTIGKADERFQEDPIRMMRAVRFAAELGFDLHKDVYEAILANRELLERVSADRLPDGIRQTDGSSSCREGAEHGR